jgi:hypothetical protein
VIATDIVVPSKVGLVASRSAAEASPCLDYGSDNIRNLAGFFDPRFSRPQGV